MDHAVDCLRYMIMSRPASSTPPKPKRNPNEITVAEYEKWSEERKRFREELEELDE